MALNMHKKGLAISKTISDCKNWKIWKIVCLQAVNLAPKMDRRRSAWHLARSSSSVVRLRPIAVLFWIKYTFPCQIKPRILKLTTSKGHSNLLTVFSFVNCEEKGYYRVVSVGLGQLSFDCCSYCGRSCRMQGKSRKFCTVSPNPKKKLPKSVTLFINNQSLTEENSIKYLGIYIDSNLNIQVLFSKILKCYQIIWWSNCWHRCF